MAEANEQRQRKTSDQDQVIAQCDRFEAEIGELRALYEQYFLGLEKRPPVDRHAELKRRLLQLKGLWVRQTAARFRVQAAAQKFATYERLWQRTLQEIENGTYRRDLARSKRRASTAAPTPDAAPESDAKAPPPDGPEAKTPAPQVKSPALSRTAPDTIEISQLSDEAVRAVYEAYVAAKKRCNEDTSRFSIEQLGQTLRKQIPELMKKHSAKRLELKVVVKDGKAVLRATPREG